MYDDAAAFFFGPFFSFSPDMRHLNHLTNNICVYVSVQRAHLIKTGLLLHEPIRYSLIAKRNGSSRYL